MSGVDEKENKQVKVKRCRTRLVFRPKGAKENGSSSETVNSVPRAKQVKTQQQIERKMARLAKANSLTLIKNLIPLLPIKGDRYDMSKKISTLVCSRAYQSDYTVYHVWLNCLFNDNVNYDHILNELGLSSKSRLKKAVSPKLIYIVGHTLRNGSIKPAGSCFLVIKTTNLKDLHLDCEILNKRIHMIKVHIAMLRQHLLDDCTLVLPFWYVDFLKEIPLESVIKECEKAFPQKGQTLVKKLEISISSINNLNDGQAIQVSQLCLSSESGSTESVSQVSQPSDPSQQQSLSAKQLKKKVKEAMQPKLDEPKLLRLEQPMPGLEQSKQPLVQRMGISVVSNNNINNSQPVQSSQNCVSSNGGLTELVVQLPDPPQQQSLSAKQLKRKARKARKAMKLKSDESKQSGSEQPKQLKPEQLEQPKQQPQVTISKVDISTKRNRLAATMNGAGTSQPKAKALPAVGNGYNPADFDAKLRAIVEDDEPRSDLVTKLLPRLSCLGNAVLRIDHLPAKLTVHALNLMMGTYGITQNQVVAINIPNAKANQPLMNVRIVLPSDSNDIKKILSRNNCRTAYDTILLIKRTDLKELEAFLRKNHAAIRDLNVEEKLSVRNIGYASYAQQQPGHENIRYQSIVRQDLPEMMQRLSVA